ncbi:hypothetical protein SAMD00023353_0403640 [Rosellinia necatrix]|uniref:Uncharacterized protein n=1 Tax=Rosellinia necatrix TaxID=77044 RepID=A0A1S8A5E4_ROSNE|nr:hypothetical protein SAMD00023353_0403640 [Rosellinia necatrix]
MLFTHWISRGRAQELDTDGPFTLPLPLLSSPFGESKSDTRERHKRGRTVHDDPHVRLDPPADLDRAHDARAPRDDGPRLVPHEEPLPQAAGARDRSICGQGLRTPRSRTTARGSIPSAVMAATTARWWRRRL